MYIDSAQLLRNPLSAVKDKLKQASTALAEITLLDLVREFDHNGVYVFGTTDAEYWEPKYVGKASSRLFFERLAGHFDTRDGAFMNNMLRKIRQSQKNSAVTLRDVAAEIAKSGTIVTIRHNDGPTCAVLENVLRHTLHGKIINAPKKRLPLADVESIWESLGGTL